MRTINAHINHLLLGLFLVCLSSSVTLFSQETSPKEQEAASKEDVPTYFNEARDYSNRNQMELALESLVKASKLAEKNENFKYLIDSYHKFSLYYLKLEKEKNSLFYWDRAKALIKEVEYPYGNAVQKFVDAVLQYRAGNNFQAIFLLGEAKQLSNDRNLYNNISLVEGHIYLTLEKYEAASKNFNSLIVNTDPFEQQYISTQGYLGMAKLNLATENFGESVKNGENALDLAIKNDFFGE
ncbi:MAG: hybrid sensor histidine kinase/response regulator, partial [Flavobacteriales bacterium]